MASVDAQPLKLAPKRQDMGMCWTPLTLAFCGQALRAYGVDGLIKIDERCARGGRADIIGLAALGFFYAVY